MLTIMIIYLLLAINAVLIFVIYRYSDKTLLRINKKITHKNNEYAKTLRRRDNYIISLKHEIQDILEVNSQLKIFLMQKDKEIKSLKAEVINKKSPEL